MTHHKNNGNSIPEVSAGVWETSENRDNIGNKISRRTAILAGIGLAAGAVTGCGNETDATGANSEASASATAVETSQQGTNESPNSTSTETERAEPHYVESGMDPNKIYGATELSTAIPGEQALMIAEMLIQWDPTKEHLVTGYYPKAHQETDENGYPVRDKNGETVQTIEVVAFGSNPDKKPSIADSMEKDLSILRMALAMVQDPDAHIRKSGSAILDTFVDNAVSLDTLAQLGESVSAQNQAKLYGDTISTESLISGSELIEAIKAYPTNPEGLEEIAPWLNKEVTITDSSDVSIDMDNTTTEYEFDVAKVVSVEGRYKNPQGIEQKVIFVVQSTSLLTDPSGVGPYEEALDVSYRVKSQTGRDWIGFEGVLPGKPKSDWGVLSTGKNSPEDTWPYNG